MKIPSVRTNSTTAAPPAFVLDTAGLDELELLLGGLLSPARGYCLPGQAPADWPAEFTLELPSSIAEAATRAGELLLTDPDGTPLAALVPDALAHASCPGSSFLAGALSPRRPAEHPPARDIRLTAPLPRTDRAPLVVAAFTRPPDAAQMARAVTAATGGVLWLVAVAGPQLPGRYDVLDLIDSLRRCAGEIPSCHVGLLIVPHAASTTSAAALTDYALGRLEADAVLNWCSEPGSSVRRADPDRRGGGLTVLFTGLSGSGKSTLARALAERLSRLDPRPITMLDGDDVRRLLSSGLGFSAEEREVNVRRIGWVAAAISRSGGIAICAPIAPRDTTRKEVRTMVEDGGARFVLVHVATSLSTCERRDRKGLYARARAGLLPQFTGIDAPYEVPRDADVVLDTDALHLDEAVDVLISRIFPGADPRVGVRPSARPSAP